MSCHPVSPQDTQSLPPRLQLRVLLPCALQVTRFKLQRLQLHVLPTCVTSGHSVSSLEASTSCPASLCHLRTLSPYPQGCNFVSYYPVQSRSLSFHSRGFNFGACHPVSTEDKFLNPVLKNNISFRLESCVSNKNWC